MGQLYDAKVELEKIIEQKKLNGAETKGKLSLKSGLLLALIRPDTPDDDARLDRLRTAVRQLLDVEI
jgi:hypothetical protein